MSFPLASRRVIVAQVADQLLALHGDPAVAFWRDTARGLKRELEGSGIRAEAAAGEVRAFFDAVQAAMCAGHETADAVA